MDTLHHILQTDNRGYGLEKLIHTRPEVIRYYKTLRVKSRQSVLLVLPLGLLMLLEVFGRLRGMLKRIKITDYIDITPM